MTTDLPSPAPDRAVEDVLSEAQADLITKVPGWYARRDDTDARTVKELLAIIARLTPPLPGEPRQEGGR